MSDLPEGEGWWQASDGKWYPPTQSPSDTPAAGQPATPADPLAGTASPGGQAPPQPGWWQAADGNWYPPQGQVPAPQAFGAPPGYKNKLVAGLLALLLCGLGIHHFYLGNTGLGIGMLSLWVVGLLTSWLLVGFFFLAGACIWSLIDGIRIFTGSMTDAQGRPLVE